MTGSTAGSPAMLPVGRVLGGRELKCHLSADAWSTPAGMKGRDRKKEKQMMGYLPFCILLPLPQREDWE